MNYIKDHPVGFAFGAAGIIIGGFLLVNWMNNREEPAPMKAQAPRSLPVPARTPEGAPVRAAAPEDGKLPWAVGDVNLWDNEDDTFCSTCRIQKSSQCRSGCPFS